MNNGTLQKRRLCSKLGRDKISELTRNQMVNSSQPTTNRHMVDNLIIIILEIQMSQRLYRLDSSPYPGFKMSRSFSLY
jgi:hypothetical protein